MYDLFSTLSLVLQIFLSYRSTEAMKKVPRTSQLFLLQQLMTAPQGNSLVSLPFTEQPLFGGPETLTDFRKVYQTSASQESLHMLHMLVCP